MPKKHKIIDPTPLKAEIFNASCVEISSYTEWRRMVKDLTRRVRNGVPVSHHGYYYKNRNAFGLSGKCCYIPECSSKEYTREALEDICIEACRKAGISYLAIYCTALFQCLVWDTPENMIGKVMEDING